MKVCCLSHNSIFRKNINFRFAKEISIKAGSIPILLVSVALLLSVFTLPAFAVEGQEIVERAFNYMRGDASISKLEMTVHRPDWERTMALKVWTKGEEESIFVITAPAKDKGNGTLKKHKDMWIFNPKVNRVIKLPPSMMSQSWQGSDFSNNDLSKTDSLKLDYIHTIEGEEVHDGKKVYLIKSMPKPGAPVIWGMQKLKIREDGIILEQAYFDEDFEGVKKLSMSEIEILGGKLYPRVWKMEKLDEEDEYTMLIYKSLEFKKSLPSNYFTLSNLRNPRR